MPIRLALTLFALLFAAFFASKLRAEETFYPSFEDLPEQAELPDPLKMRSGKPVTTKEQWFKERRPEIVNLVQWYMYGIPPLPPANIPFEVLHEDREALGGKATLQEVALTVGPGAAPKIRLLVIVPNNLKRKAPVFLGVNFCGNHTVVADPKIAIPDTWMYKHCPGCEDDRATEKGRGGQADVWCPELLIDRGYALATFYNGDIDPDQPSFDDGIHKHFFKAKQKELSPHDWGAIAAWAWGASRAVDYLVKRDDINPERIGIVGHSRLGKTALLAGALDERIALVVPHQSGTGGCAASRFNNQETVKRINTVFPHWFNGAFKEYNDRESKLPIDQHFLMALIAPRPLLDTEGEQDTWANFDNALRSVQAADKVYKFLGAEGIKGDGRVEGDESLQDAGNLVQYRRNEKHVLTADYWNKILEFADAQYGIKK